MEDPAELITGIRDLTSLMVLPALWTGRSAQEVATFLFDALESVLEPEVILLQQEGGENPLCLIKHRGAAAQAPSGKWLSFAEDCFHQIGLVETLDAPIGRLRVVRAQMMVSSPAVTLWVGSQDPTFPRRTQHAYLVAATTLVATGLYSARLQDERNRADRAKDEFLAMLAHELRNPLAPMVMAATLLERRQIPDIQFEQGIISRQLKHLTRIVDDLLDVARISKGKIELRLDLVDFSQVIAAAGEIIQVDVDRRRQRLEMAVAPRLLVQGDADRLQQVVTNLLTNAVKFTPDGGVIEVLACRRDGKISFTVTDHGVGIDPGLLPRIFDLFVQGNVALDRSNGGLGVGLALVRSLVRMHHGEVFAASEGVGRGSVFTVELPAAKECLPDAPEKESDECASSCMTPAALRRLA